ncbi:MAG: O-methyltransferase [Actinomycetota bacterium]
MRALPMNDDLLRYAIDHINPPADPVAAELAAVTVERFGGRSAMNIAEDQGRFLKMLVEISGASTVVEVGTFTGMSALWLARGLPPGGRLICFELVDTYLETAQAAWEAAGVHDRIEVRIGPAAAGLAALPAEPHVDLAFIDADKGGYRSYLDLLLPRLAHGGTIAVDNVLWSGAVIDPNVADNDTEALRAFNRHVADHDELDAAVLTIGDGITLIRHRGSR